MGLERFLELGSPFIRSGGEDFSFGSLGARVVKEVHKPAL